MMGFDGIETAMENNRLARRLSGTDMVPLKFKLKSQDGSQVKEWVEKLKVRHSFHFLFFFFFLFLFLSSLFFIFPLSSPFLFIFFFIFYGFRLFLTGGSWSD